MVSEQKRFGHGSVGAGPALRRELVSGSDLQCSASVRHVFANGALLFCPLLADSSRKVGDECRWLCRAVDLSDAIQEPLDGKRVADGAFG